MEDWIIPRKGSVPFHLSIEMEDGSKGYADRKERNKANLQEMQNE